MTSQSDWYAEDTPAFDEQHHVQNVRVINRMTWLELTVAVAVGTAIGLFGAAFLLITIGLADELLN